MLHCSAKHSISLLVSLALLLTGLLPLSMTAQETDTDTPAKVRIHGFVKDRDGLPVVLATVRVVGEASGAVSDSNGAYSFSLPARGDSLTLEARCIGYKTIQKSFSQGIKAELRLDFTLPEGDLLLGAVTVTAESKKKAAMETIKAEHVKVVASPTGGVESLVGTYAGVTQNNEISSQYSVRGGSYEENMVYVNGMEVYRPLLVRTAQQEGLSFVQPEMIQSVNFSAGGFTAEYGDKMSSVLDIRYRTPESFEASVGLGIQGDHIYIGGKKGPFSMIAGARYKDGKNLLQGLETKGEYRPIYVDAQTFARYVLSPKWQISFLGNISFTRYRFIPQTRETQFGTIAQVKNLKVYFDGQEQDRFLSFYGNLSVSFRPSDNQLHTLSLVGYSSHEAETYDIEGSYFLADLDSSEGDESGAVTSLSALATGGSIEHARNRLNYTLLNTGYRFLWNFNDTHTIKAGMDARLERVQDHISEWVMLDSAGYSLPHSEERINMQYNLYSDNRLSTVRLGAFLLDQITFDASSGIWQLYPGLRASYYHFTREFIASPRFVMAFAPKDVSGLTIRAATGLYYQAPFYKELRKPCQDTEGNNYIELNRDIRSQGSVHILLGGDYEFELSRRRFRFTAESYFKYLFRLNPYRVDNVKVHYLGENLGKGYVMGLDLKFYGEFVPEVDSWITFSLLKSKQILPGIGTMPLPNAPSYNFSLFFQDYFPGFKPIRLSLRTALSGGLPQFRPSADFEMPMFTGKPYTRVDIGIIYRVYDRSRRENQRLSWLKSFDVAVELFNLFDNANVSGYYWITDANLNQFAVPNYLTRRYLNLRIVANF